MLANDQRRLRNQLFELCMRCMKLDGACIAIVERVDLFGHEVGVVDLEHLYDRMGALQDAWADMVRLPAWQAIDDAPLEDELE